MRPRHQRGQHGSPATRTGQLLVGRVVSRTRHLVYRPLSIRRDTVSTVHQCGLRAIPGSEDSGTSSILGHALAVGYDARERGERRQLPHGRLPASYRFGGPCRMR